MPLKRRNVSGCNCCTECYQISNSELPCLTPPAGWNLLYTWSGDNCCKCIVYYREQDGSFACDDYVGGVTSTAVYEQNWLDSNIPPPPEVCGGNCATLRTQGAYYCCASGVFVGAKSTTTATTDLQYRIRRTMVQEQIKICVRRDTVICNGTPATKWIVHMQYSFGFDYDFFLRRKAITVSRTFSNIASCFSINTASQPNDCECNTNFSDVNDYPCTLEGFQQAGGILGGSSTGATFDRVLFFDPAAWPPAQLLFDADAVPGNCSYSICNKGTNFDNQVCFTISAFPLELKPCWCDATFTCTTIPTDVSLAIPCLQASALAGCNCDPEAPAIVSPCGEYDSYTCGTYTINCLSCTLTGELPQTIPATCWRTDNTSSGYSPASAYDNILRYPWLSACPTGNLPLSVGPFCTPTVINYCTNAATCPTAPPCGSCCHEYGDCQCATKFGNAGVETTSFTQDLVCTWNGWTYCVNRPNFTFAVVPC